MQILTKLDIGDDIFYMKDNKVVCEIVEEIYISVTKDMYQHPTVSVVYKTKTMSISKNVFATRHELLNSL